MSVTEETIQVLRVWLKEVAPSNMLYMSVTEETFQLERSPSKEEAVENMPRMLVTFDRFGASVARYTMLVAP